MRARLLRSLTMLLCCLSILCSAPKVSEHVEAPTLTRVPPAGMTAVEMQALKARQAELTQLADFYNYEPKTPLAFEVVRCPLITKHVVMEFTSVEVSEGSSTFVAVLPQQNGRVELIPLWYKGLRSFENPYNDPHNIAIFNETIKNEAPRLASAADWLQLGVCYLGMVGEMPHVLLPTSIREQSGNVDQRITKQLLPTVITLKQTVHVNFHDARSKTVIWDWHLRFDQSGLLRDISRESREKSDL